MEPALLTPELRKQLESCNNLPSPPGVATKIIRLANDPEADMGRIAQVLALDPAITAKILRIANSPMYARQRKTENLRQALLVIGLNATISLALSFSLLKSWQRHEGSGGLDYPLYWRRALLSATASHVLARAIGVKDAEELFLACLIQDIGLMALDRTIPDLYAGLGGDQVHQASLIERERQRLGVDHATVSGWLLEKWQFPERTQQVVAASHEPERIPKQSPNGVFARCVALASMIAEVFLDNTGERAFLERGPLVLVPHRLQGLRRLQPELPLGVVQARVDLLHLGVPIPIALGELGLLTLEVADLHLERLNLRVLRDDGKGVGGR